MRALAAWILAAGILAAGATMAQPPERGKGGRGGMRGMGGMGGQQGGVMLLNNKSVQDELKISDEQKDKIKAFIEDQGKKMQEKMADLRSGGGNFQDPDFRKKMADDMRKFGEEAMKDLKEKKILKDEQVHRLHQIGWQQLGPQGTTHDEHVQKALKLTGDQKDKYKSMVEEYTKDMGELRRAAFGGDSDAQKKIEALRKEIKEKSVEVLTADQKKAWHELVGKEFEVKQEARTGGGRGKRPEKKG